MKISKGLGTLALMALSVGASWVLLAPDAVPAAAPAAATTAADGQGFSVLAWPRPAPEAPHAAAATAMPATPAPQPEMPSMKPTLEDDAPPPQ